MYKPLYVCLDAHDDAIENEVLSEVARVKMLAAKSESELSDSDLSEASVVAVWHTIWIDQPLLARLPRCVAIVRMGVGYDNVDIAAAGRLGISVCNIPDYGTEEVADSEPRPVASTSSSSIPTARTAPIRRLAYGVRQPWRSC
jgi:lactate dehydrogenase-like 2-hydroxyacid dehydrogenase